MARSVQEGDGAAVDLHGVSANVLGDAAGLTGGHIGMADIVQQRGLAVVNVTHNYHNGGAADQLLFLVLMIVDQPLLNGDDDFLLHLATHFHGHQSGGVIIDHVGDRGKNAQLEQLLNDLGGGFLHTGGQLAHGDLVRDLHLQLLLLGDLQLEPVHFIPLLLTAFGGSRLLVGALLGLALDLFLVAPAHVVAVGLVAGHIVIALVVLLNIHGSAATGIHHSLLCHLAGYMGLVLLFLSSLLCRSGVLCGRSGSGRLLRRLCVPVILLFLLSALLLCGGSGLGRLCLGGNIEDLLQAGHLVVLGHIVEDNVQLMIFQNLHVVLGGGHIVRKDLADDLGRDVEILCHLVNPVLYHAHTLVLLFPILLFLSWAAASFFRRCAFSKRPDISPASAA